MRQLGMEEKHLCPTTTIIRVASKEKLTVLGMVPVLVQAVGHPSKQTIQALYITKELSTLFISRTCLLQLGCLPQTLQSTTLRELDKRCEHGHLGTSTSQHPSYLLPQNGSD